jgi:hypothetical protein
MTGGWSPETAIAMERRHIIEAEKRVARQEALVMELVRQGHDQLTHAANHLLSLFRESLELSRDRLRDLEQRYGTSPEKK